MKPTPIGFIIYILLAATIIWAVPGESAAPTPGPSKIVKEAMDRYRDFLLNDSTDALYYRLRAGLKIHRLPGYSYNASAARAKKVQAMMAKLKTINRTGINYDDSLSIAILEWEMNRILQLHRFFPLQSPISMYGSRIPDLNRFLSNLEFKEKEDMSRYAGLANQYADFIADVTAVLKEQYQKGIILPKPALKNAVNYLQSLIQPTRESILYVPSKRLKAPTIDPKEAGDFQKKLARVGLWQYPGGKEFYRFLVKLHISLPVTPEDIHRTGLEQIEILRKEMGIYNDPYDECGFVMGDLFMAVRLVVDTGMNYFQWPRKKAMDFMEKYLLLPRVEIESETL
ncbi:MAG: DUF885 family protein, partial [bacterium]|nr:DUF885 family protein [bacterium]